MATEVTTKNPYINKDDQNNQSSNPLSSLGNFNSAQFLTGLLVGAAATYILTNENTQKAIFKSFAKGSQLFQAGLEEMKERFEDAKAEAQES